MRNSWVEGPNLTRSEAPRTGRRQTGRASGSVWREINWHLVPSPPVQLAPIARLLHATPLLEEEGHFLPFALTADLANPCRIHGPRTGSAFAADDDPMNAFQDQSR